MIPVKSRLSHFANPRANKTHPYPGELGSILSIDDAEQTYKEISTWPGYQVTDLHSLSGISQKLGINKLRYKDEGKRFGLGSFKALGGAYAVFVELKRIIQENTGQVATIHDLIDKRF